MTKPEKNTPQGIGSALTYMRRYSLSAAFGITSDQDDDGNQASGHISKPVSKPDPKNIKSLEDEIEMFSQLMQSNGKDIPPEKVKAQLNIQDINQLSNNQIATMISTLDKWSKQAKESK
jgi:hypothetical protein